MLGSGLVDQPYHYQCLYRGKENRLEGGSSFSVTTEMFKLFCMSAALKAVLALKFNYGF